MGRVRPDEGDMIMGDGDAEAALDGAALFDLRRIGVLGYFVSCTRPLKDYNSHRLCSTPRTCADSFIHLSRST